MTTPPIEPPEPAESSGPPPRYETRTLWVTAVITVLVLSGLTLVFFMLGLLAPVTLIVALFFIRKDATPHRRSIVTGVILGSGIALLTTAGICTAVINGSLGA